MKNETKRNETKRNETKRNETFAEAENRTARTRVVAARRPAREIRRDLRLRLAAESREHGSVPVRDAARRVFRERRDDDAPPREDVAVAVAVGDANHRRRIVVAVAVAVASLDVFSVAA